MAIHFEELWEKSEGFFKEAGGDATVQSIADELALKINLYKSIDTKSDIPEEDRQKVKSRVLGEILLTLTHLSLKDNINVYESLTVALQYRNIEYYIKKHPQP